jgi:ATP-dependent DNA helicase RecG
LGGEPEADLDTNEINSTIRATGKSSCIQFRNINNTVAVLEDLGVSKYGRLTNGGDVLFCKNPSTRYPQLRVRAACFTEDRTDDTYKDMQFYEGPLVSLLEQVYGFIQRNTSTAAHFSKDNQSRQDKPLYPNEAVREGLVNAFSHRDYSDFSGGIAVHIYPNRLEIWNSGSLPHGVTLDSLTIGHISVLRNPDIAHVLYLRGLMEKLGRGSVLIQKACKEHGLPRPVWHSEEGYGVSLTFFTPEVTPEVIRVLLVIEGSMSSRELREKLGLKDDEYFRTTYLRPALEEHYIEMTVPDKPTSSRQKYRMTDFGQSAIKH